MENRDILFDNNDLLELIPHLSHWLIPIGSWVILVNGRLWHSVGSNNPRTYWASEKNARNSFKRHVSYRMLHIYANKVLNDKRGGVNFWALPGNHQEKQDEIVEQGLKLLEDTGVVEYIQITEQLKFKKDE